jgi:uncharacterized membrane protein YkoI
MWAKPLLFALAAASVLNGPVNAQPRPEVFQPEWIMPVQDRRDDRQEIRPLRDVVEMLRSRYGGELISARLEQGGRPIYVIRWRMPDGEVRDFRIDAVSGR